MVQDSERAELSQPAVGPRTDAPEPATASLVEMCDLTYERNGHRLLDSISLTVRRGEYVAVMGPNGSGKTTLIRHLNGLLLPTDGVVRIAGDPTTDVTKRNRIRQTVGIVFQDPDDQMVAVTVEDEIAFGLENLRWERKRMTARVEEALVRFHLENVRDRQTTSLSGGEQQRVAIASIWATDPALLVLDEPTSMLDRPSAQELLRLLDSLSQLRTIIHVTQQVAEARRAERVIVLVEGRIVADGAAADVLADERTLRDLGILRRTGDERRTPTVQTETRASAVEAIGVEHIRRDGPHEVPVLHGVSANARSGSVLAVVGRSGSGKSTFAWHLNRLLEPTAGKIRLEGTDARSIPLSDVRRRVGLTFQRTDLQLFEATVADDVAFGLRERGASEEECVRRSAEMLDALGLPYERYATRRPATLSVGEQRRVALAGVLVMDPSVIVFDEPTSGLDARGTDALHERIERLRREGRTLIVVTHDLEFARSVADHILVLENGRGETQDDAGRVLGELVARWSVTAYPNGAP